MSRPRVLLAEDHAPMARALRALLEPRYDLLPTVSDGETLVTVARDAAPDVIVSDIGMPGVSGLDAAEAILGMSPGARIVFVSLHTDRATVARALAIGGIGFVAKVDAAEELIAAVESARHSVRYLSRSLLP